MEVAHERCAPKDVLIYGIGAQTNDFNTPGVQEHAFFFKELTDARKVGESESKDLAIAAFFLIHVCTRNMSIITC
jgi:NADH dehydrogenase FAD-containing subunit